MNRRDFLTLLGSGALATMLVPSVAEAFASKQLSVDDLFDRIQDGSGLVTQQATVVGRMNQRVDGKEPRYWVKIGEPTQPMPSESPGYIRPYVTPAREPAGADGIEYFSKVKCAPSGSPMKSGWVPVKGGDTIDLTYQIEGQPWEATEEVYDYSVGRDPITGEYPLKTVKRMEYVYYSTNACHVQRIAKFVTGHRVV